MMALPWLSIHWWKSQAFSQNNRQFWVQWRVGGLVEGPTVGLSAWSENTTWHQATPEVQVEKPFVSLYRSGHAQVSRCCLCPSANKSTATKYWLYHNRFSLRRVMHPRIILQPRSLETTCLQPQLMGGPRKPLDTCERTKMHGSMCAAPQRLNLPRNVTGILFLQTLACC